MEPPSKHESIQAYDIPERVAMYDSDMELMHPNRNKMAEIVLELLPFSRNDSFIALDLGVGTGFFSKAVLTRFPRCRVIAVDGAVSMVEMARTRLGPLADRVDFRIGDFRFLNKSLSNGERGELVYSAYALHHLTVQEKRSLIRDALTFLKPGGWFLNADLVVAADAGIESRIQEIRVRGIVERAGGRDNRFANTSSTREFLDDLEARDNDKPLTLTEDLQVLKEAGLENASVFWTEYREAVTGGYTGTRY
jgi:tRNA (cmo5U34)-methyltransferase